MRGALIRGHVALGETAMEEEFNFVQNLKSPDITPTREKGPVLHTKFVVRQKRGDNGEMIKYKTRLWAYRNV